MPIPDFSAREKEMISSFMSRMVNHIQTQYPKAKEELGEGQFRSLCNEVFERLLEKEPRLLVLDHQTVIDQNRGTIKAIYSLNLKNRKMEVSPPSATRPKPSTLKKRSPPNSSNKTSPSVSPIYNSSFLKIISPGSPNSPLGGQDLNKSVSEKDHERSIAVLDLRLKLVNREMQKMKQSFEDKIEALTEVTQRQNDTITNQNKLIYELYKTVEKIKN